MYVSGNGFAMLNLACLDKHVQGFGNWKSHSYLSHEVEVFFIFVVFIIVATHLFNHYNLSCPECH